MASSSTSSSVYTNFKSSRFSTSLKAFKLPTKKPPVPPPKDVYYLRNNRSLASLPTDSLSLPNSPLSPHSQHSLKPSPDMQMNNSSVSLVSSAASARSFSPGEPAVPPVPPLPPQPQKRSKSGAFFKFGRKSPKAGSIKSPPPPDALPPPPVEDDNISMPWNFQHNIHVDEGFTGLPPSWTTSLVQAGFTEEEIADIQSRRRTGSRSPNSQYLFTDRPATPNHSNAVVITHPTPRTSSLPRQFSDLYRSGSADGWPRSPSSLNPSLSGVTPNPNASKRQLSADQTSTHHPSASVHSLAQSISASADSHATSSSVSSFIQDASTRPVLVTSPIAEAPERPPPSTPPRHEFHITNEAPLNSPPPSYTSSNSEPENGYSYPLDTKVSAATNHTSNVTSTPSSHLMTISSSDMTSDTTPQTQKQQHPLSTTDLSHDHTSSDSSASNDSDPPRTYVRSPDNTKRLTAFPPRLSLHKSKDSTDLTSWGEALLSGISTASDLTPNTSTSAKAQESKLKEGVESFANDENPPPMNSIYYAHAEAEAPVKNQASSKPTKKLPPTRPIPALNVYPEEGSFPSYLEDEDAPSSSFVEPSSTARYDPNATSWDEPEPEPEPLSSSLSSSVLSETVSPLWNELSTLVAVGKSAEPSDAALTETFSPTLPFSPYEGADAEDIIKGRRVTIQDKLLKADEDGKGSMNRESARSSTSTVTAYMEPATIVRKISIVHRAGAYVIDQPKVGEDDRSKRSQDVNRQSPPTAQPTIVDVRQPPSPLSSNFGSEDGSASGSGSSSSMSQGHQTPTTEPGFDSSLMYYLDSTATPDPTRVSFLPNSPHKLLVSTTDTFGGIKEYEVYDDDQHYDEESSGEMGQPHQPPLRPKIVINGDPASESPMPTTISSSGVSPLSPFQRYRGWLSEVVAPLEEFIDEAIDPRDYYLDLQEIAEGESGSVFAARLTDMDIHKLKLPPLVKARDADDLENGRTTVVAIKSVAILPSGSPKLVDLERELSLMKGLCHDNLLAMDAVYVDLVEDTLWIRMELMERSLADIIGLVPQGLVLQDRTIARLASDVLQALVYLQKHRIAHRDVRSDNLLINSQGILKLTDFSNAVQVREGISTCSDIIGVAYWQAPEVRTPPYDALKVDVWSLGATVWEMAEAEPPFAKTGQLGERWPPLTKPQLYPPAYHEFLRICSEPAVTRPTPIELTKNSFIANSCGRLVIIQLISQCMAIEQVFLEGDTSRGTVSK